MVEAVEPSPFLERFERLQIAPEAFRHREHVEAAYEMLRRYPFLEATFRYAKAIKSLAENAGAARKFNVTITIAFMAIIAERLEACEPPSFEAFRRQNPDLFSAELLERFYSAERLHSDVARRIFVMPDPHET